MPSSDDRRVIRFWQPDVPGVAGMLRVEREDRVRTTYSEHFLIAVVYAGAFDGWYRGAVRTHVAGAIKLKEPGEVHRDLKVHAPFTIQGASFSREAVTAAASAVGLRGAPQFRASGFGPGERAARLAFAMHAALVRLDASELERTTLVAEVLGEVLGDGARLDTARASDRTRAVRVARAYLHDTLADKITLDEVAARAGMDKFRLVRAFRAEVGVPPYEYVTQARVAKARELLRRGALVADAAQEVGFCDESQLHRHFRRILGIPPGRFARSVAAPARRSQHRPIGGRERSARSPHDSSRSR
jgi:AraC-like DNA-binding protein